MRRRATSARGDLVMRPIHALRFCLVLAGSRPTYATRRSRVAADPRGRPPRRLELVERGRRDIVGLARRGARRPLLRRTRGRRARAVLAVIVSATDPVAVDAASPPKDLTLLRRHTAGGREDPVHIRRNSCSSGVPRSPFRPLVKTAPAPRAVGRRRGRPIGRARPHLRRPQSTGGVELPKTAPTSRPPPRARAGGSRDHAARTTSSRVNVGGRLLNAARPLRRASSSAS